MTYSILSKVVLDTKVAWIWVHYFMGWRGFGYTILHNNKED